jgi:tetratricopeptide (TPR) repeat protein
MSDSVIRLQDALKERYVLQRELGRGGMGTVFLAEDRKHHRQVAIKVLNPELAAAVGPERFLREVMLTAQLDHPHILSLLDSGEADGFLYYVMPYVEGESLRDRLNREKQLSIEEAVRIAREVADALGHAHSRGIIHRDVKPENIMLAGGHARVVDFGVARAITAVSAASITIAGTVLGTPSYMSPEQAAGQQDLDGRSDLYSLGCVLYEMLTGEVPHLGATPRATLAKRLSEPPPRVSVLRDSVPAGIEEVLDQALARIPADRIATARAFSDRLASQEPGPAGISSYRATPRSDKVRPSGRLRVTIAVGIAAMLVATALLIQAGRERSLPPVRVVVLPFDDRTGDPSLEGLGALVADWVTHQLAQSGVVQVVPAASVRAHWRLIMADSGSALSALPPSVRAGTIVSGALRLADGELQLETEVIDARNGELLDALDVVTAPRDSTKALIGVASQRIVAALALRLNPQFQWARPTARPPSLEAFRVFQDGMVLFGQLRLPEALTGLYRARATDSTYLAPLLPAAAAHIMLGQLAPAESLLVALGPLQDALTSEDRAHREWLLAWINGDLDQEYRAAEELFASAPETFAYHLGLTGVRTNRPARALEALPRADLESPWMRDFYLYWLFYGDANHALGRLQSALEVTMQGRRLHPNAPGLLTNEILARASLGQVREVDSLLDRSATLPIGEAISYALTSSMAALEYRAHGHAAASDALLRRTLDRLASESQEDARTPAYRFALARVLYWRGQWEDALPLLEQLVREGPVSLDRLGYLGTTFARLDRRSEAIAISEQLRVIEQPYLLGANTFWRARIVAVLGDQAQAVRLLRQAIGEGQTYGMWVHREPDFEALRSYAPFDDFLRPDR